MVNEALGEPPLSLRTTDPAHIFGLTRYEAEIEIQFVSMFKTRAADLMQKHLAAGKP